MPKQDQANPRRPGQRPSRSELRNSIVWPVIISVVIWLTGLIVWIVAPGRFDALVSGVIAVGLIIYLIWYQRRLRLTPRAGVAFFPIARVHIFSCLQQNQTRQRFRRPGVFQLRPLK